MVGRGFDAVQMADQEVPPPAYHVGVRVDEVIRPRDDDQVEILVSGDEAIHQAQCVLRGDIVVELAVHKQQFAA